MDSQLYQILLHSKNQLSRELNTRFDIPENVQENIAAAIVYMDCACQNLIDGFKSKVIPIVVKKTKD